MKRQLFKFIIGLSFLLTACNSTSPPMEKIDDFTFTDQNGQRFGTNELQGNIWLADFIFTNCETVCRPMTSEMANLQAQLKVQGFPVHLVSFSVDPTTDTPEVLSNYMVDFTDDLSNWHLLTGYTQNEIEDFAREQFKTIVQKPNLSTQVIHGTNFYLIDQEGQLINEYNYIDPTYIETLLDDIEALLK